SASSGREQPSESREIKAADRWIEVSGTPGQAYVLQQFQLLPVYAFSASGRYWVSSVSTGAVGDEADTTGALVTARVENGRRRAELIGSAAVEVGADHPFVRRFNALGDLSLFVQVATPGAYGILARGASARFRVHPFTTTPVPDAKLPAF